MEKIDEGGLLNPIEVVVYRKARSVPDLPQTKVISEFLDVKDKCPKKIQSWKRPQLVRLQDYALRKLEWPEEYTEEKILPL
ncbi:hypothetical protein FSP39_002889 [Pinctada imbricata]|uniref:Uncharacterized protein n=1 Tax=Pinctada imbricata TaxID=66713 RepID=A0AA88YLX8_PINIB|nr:hypothetical protein FSP39_002889 [Pinctada imbricata]